MGDLNGAKAGGRSKNAARLPSKPGPYRSPALRLAGPDQDPMSRVLSNNGRVPVAVTAAFAVFLHVGMAAGATAASMFQEIFAWQKAIHDMVSYRLDQYEVDVVKEQPPEPPKPEPEPEPEKPAPKDPTPPPEAPPPALAEVGKVLTADPTPSDGPVDLTNTFVSGSGSDFAGGRSSAEGTSKKPVYNPAAVATGSPTGTGTGPAAPPPRKDDKSKQPGLLGSVDWNDCPFPGEADAEQIDHAFVMIQVKVKPDGSPENVSVLQDPGHGFGREARKCAMRKKYSQGLDPDGNPIAGTTKPFRVRFER